MRKISEMGEFGLIKEIRKMVHKNSRVRAGIGDDCAVADVPESSQELLMTVDNVVEGVHFDKSVRPYWIGRKAMARSISDIAAMGGTPQYALITLGTRGECPYRFVKEVYRGLGDMAKFFGAAIVGGDVTSSPKYFFISVALTGIVPKNKALLRSGARSGDFIFVTGNLGGAILGKHFRFRPRVAEGTWLRKNGIPSAMIDVSDGLISDLCHILEESRVGARVSVEKIPISRAARKLARQDGRTPMDHALQDGEDYELLFTSRVRDHAWMREFESRFGVGVTCMGQCTHKKTVLEWEDEKKKRGFIKPQGFAHF